MGMKVKHLTVFGPSLSFLTLFHALIAELVGTFLLVYVPCTACMANPGESLLCAMAWGLTVSVLITIFGATSGAHFNPAVTLAFACNRWMGPFVAIMYIAVQIMGATGAAGALLLTTPKHMHGDNFSLTVLEENIGIIEGIVVEVVGTYVLIMTVLVVADPFPNKEYQGTPAITVGLAVTCAILFAGTWTGASLNPARSLGPAIVWNKYSNVWVFVVGPFIGSLLAVATYKVHLQRAQHNKDKPKQYYNANEGPVVVEMWKHQDNRDETKQMIEG